MKKIKVMLLSLALFAIVGAALAFKAKFNTDFCITEANGDFCVNLTCPTKVTQSQLVNVLPQNRIYCTAPAPAGECGEIQCDDQVTTSLIDNIPD